MTLLNDYLLNKLFKNGRPSTKWYYGFIERHKKELSVKYSNNLPSNRAMSTDVNDSFFN